MLDPRILDVARRAARSASRLCLAVLEEAPETPDAMAKLGKEPVTVADYGSQAVLLHALSTAGQGDFALANRLYRVRPSLSSAALVSSLPSSR